MVCSSLIHFKYYSIFIMYFTVGMFSFKMIKMVVFFINVRKSQEVKIGILFASKKKKKEIFRDKE
jgi:hypothetical protein